MHLGPDDARAYFKPFRAGYNRHEGREAWFFPPAVSLEAAAQAARERPDLLVGAQDIHWEPKGAYTGAVSAPLAVQAGARATLVGHSERRHLFGETDEDTRRKMGAALGAGLGPVLCVGEDRKSVVEGKRVDLGGRRIIKKKKKKVKVARAC